MTPEQFKTRDFDCHPSLRYSVTDFHLNDSFQVLELLSVGFFRVNKHSPNYELVSAICNKKIDSKPIDYYWLFIRPNQSLLTSTIVTKSRVPGETIQLLIKSCLL